MIYVPWNSQSATTTPRTGSIDLLFFDGAPAAVLLDPTGATTQAPIVDETSDTVFPPTDEEIKDLLNAETPGPGRRATTAATPPDDSFDNMAAFFDAAPPPLAEPPAEDTVDAHPFVRADVDVLLVDPFFTTPSNRRLARTPAPFATRKPKKARNVRNGVGGKIPGHRSEH